MSNTISSDDVSTLPKDYYYFFRNTPDKYGFPSDPVMRELWDKPQPTQKGNMAFGWVAYRQPLSPDALKQFDLFVDEVESVNHEKARLYLSAISRFTLKELLEQEATVRRWSIRFPYMEKEIEDEYKMYLELRKAEVASREADRKEKASKPQSEQAKDLYKQMRKTNSVRELDDWRNRVLFEAHLTDVQEDILMRELAGNWRIYLESRGVPAFEKLDKLGADLPDDEYYFGTEVTIHPTTTIFDDRPIIGIIHTARNRGELFEVAWDSPNGSIISRVPIERLYVRKLVTKPEPRYQAPAKKIEDYKGVPYILDKDRYVWVQDTSLFPKLEKHYVSFSEFKQHVDTLEKRKQDEGKPKFEIQNPFGVDLSKSIVSYPELQKPKENLNLTNTVRTIKLQVGKEEYNVSHEGQAALATLKMFFEKTEYYDQIFKKPYKAIVFGNMPEYDRILKFFKENNTVIIPQKKELLKPNPSSEDYKSGYNTAIAGRVHAPVPSWSDQGQADYSAGYSEGKRILYEQPKPDKFAEIQAQMQRDKDKIKEEYEEVATFGQPIKKQEFIPEFGKPIQHIPEKPRVLGTASRQEQTEREQRKRFDEGKRLKGQQSLTSAISTSRRLGDFEIKEKPVMQPYAMKPEDIQAEQKENNQKMQEAEDNLLLKIAERDRKAKQIAALKQQLVE